MKNCPLPRLDRELALHASLQRYCRLRSGEVWIDPTGKHRVGCLDAASPADVTELMQSERAELAIQDPPYNFTAFDHRCLQDYLEWCRRWLEVTTASLAADAALYVWLGADQRHGFQPLADFMILMRDTPFESRAFITMRNQRGYGTQKNWMAVRQELLYYTKGCPNFNAAAEYTAIPKILRGYYKTVNGHRTENLERSRSDTIRAGNVWVDIQQVFYRMQENVNGCYAQKPLKSYERILEASSRPSGLVIDFFAHSGTALLASEILGRRCLTCDIDPIYCEIAIRRLERYRATGRLGWQNGNPFEAEQRQDPSLRSLMRAGRGTRPKEPTLFDKLEEDDGGGAAG